MSMHSGHLASRRAAGWNPPQVRRTTVRPSQLAVRLRRQYGGQYPSTHCGQATAQGMNGRWEALLSGKEEEEEEKKRKPGRKSEQGASLTIKSGSPGDPF